MNCGERERGRTVVGVPLRLDVVRTLRRCGQRPEIPQQPTVAVMRRVAVVIAAPGISRLAGQHQRHPLRRLQRRRRLDPKRLAVRVFGAAPAAGPGQAIELVKVGALDKRKRPLARSEAACGWDQVGRALGLHLPLLDLLHADGGGDGAAGRHLFHGPQKTRSVEATKGVLVGGWKRPERGHVARIGRRPDQLERACLDRSDGGQQAVQPERQLVVGAQVRALLAALRAEGP